jgi:hypothetical protein
MRLRAAAVALPLKLTLEVASRVIGLVRDDDARPTTVRVPPPQPTYVRPSPPPPRRRERPAGNGGAPPVQPVHVSEEPELVAESAERGAEEGAGAEVHVDEPWAGYTRMTAADIRARLRVEPPAVAAAVSLYEASSKGRSSVLEAAARRVRLSAPPSG